MEVVLPTFRADTWKIVLDLVYYEHFLLSDVTQGLELLECVVYYQMDDLKKMLMKGIASLRCWIPRTVAGY